MAELPAKPADIPARDSYINAEIKDIPGEKGRLLVAADGKLLGCQVVPFHGIFPGNPGLRHIQENAGQPTVSPGQNRLKQHLLGLVMAEMDIRGPGKSGPEQVQPAFQFADHLPGRALSRGQTLTDTGMELKVQVSRKQLTDRRMHNLFRRLMGSPSLIYDEARPLEVGIGLGGRDHR
jgi:hypothetical protein